MKSKQLRTFLVNDKEMIFNVSYFQEMFLRYACKESKGIVNYEYEVAEALYVDRSAIHNWRMNKNGPGDIEKIQLLAKLWNVKYESLLVEVKNMATLAAERKLTEREQSALKNVYLAFLHYMENFNLTTGFVWNEDGTNFAPEIAYALYEDLRFALKEEYIDLKRTVYDDLEDFMKSKVTYTLEMYDIDDEENDESPDARTEGLYEYLMEEFKEIVDKYLV